jgi:hypothetical protein
MTARIFLNRRNRRSHRPEVSKITAIPSLSKAGMPSRSEGWGGLFKDEQYRLIRSASRASIRWLRDFAQTTPGASRPPLLTKEGNGAEAQPTTSRIHGFDRLLDHTDKRRITHVCNFSHRHPGQIPRFIRHRESLSRIGFKDKPHIVMEMFRF